MSRQPFYAPLLASSGVWVALCATAAFLLMLSALLGPFEACGSSSARVAAKRLGAWIPESAVGDASNAALAVWRAALAPGTRLLESSSLDELEEAGVGAVIVPRARHMDAAERARLIRYVEEGGGAVVAGAIGVRDADDTWLGWDAMAEFLQVSKVTPLPRDASYFVAAGPRGPLTAGLDPGQRIALAAEEGVPALEKPDAAIQWSSFTLEPVAPASAAAQAQQRGRGRLVWLAAGPEYAADAPASRQGLGRIASAALAWAGRLPVVDVLPWPDGAPFAVLLAMDTEEQYANAGSVAAIARREGLPVTFLALSELAREHADLTRELATVGEVGSHGDVHDGFAGQDPESQLARLQRTRADLEALGLPPLRGFRPPLLSYDEATLRAASASHFDYVLGNHDFASLAPSLSDFGNGGGNLVQIARIMRDDVDLIQRRGIDGRRAIVAAALEDAQRVAIRGGLYYFSFHSQLLAVPERVEAVATLGQGLRERGAWMARGAELAGWWRARAGLQAEVSRVGPRRLRVAVVHRGDAPLAKAVLRVHLNRRVEAVRLQASTIFQALREATSGARPALRLDPDAELVDLPLPVLAPGQRAAWFLDLD